MGRFLNSYEEVTYNKLRAVTEPVGAHVFSKVRLADVIPVNNSGISNEEFSYSLKAHVDFLVTNAEQDVQFCVEFDGPTHRQPEQIRRDEIKNQLLTKFRVPFIRINSRYLEDRYRGLDLLTYFVDVWFLAQAFDEAQERGQIPPEETFDPTFIISDGQPNGKKWPYWISIELQTDIQRMFKKQLVAQPSPSDWIGTDSHGNYRCIAWLFLTPETCVFIETGMRGHSFPAVYSSDLLSQLAIYELHEKTQRAISGSVVPVSRDVLDSRLEDYKRRFEFRCSAGCNLPRNE
jgi:hypothetical protein